MNEITNESNKKEVQCFEQRVFDAIQARSIHVQIATYKKQVKKKSEYEDVVLYRYADDTTFRAYCHWLAMLSRGFVDRDNFNRLCSFDGCSKYFHESDTKIPVEEFIIEQPEAKQIPQPLKEDINAAAKRKESAHELIDKYFGVKI